MQIKKSSLVNLYSQQSNSSYENLSFSKSLKISQAQFFGSPWKFDLQFHANQKYNPFRNGFALRSPLLEIKFAVSCKFKFNSQGSLKVEFTTLFGMRKRVKSINYSLPLNLEPTNLGRTQFDVFVICDL